MRDEARRILLTTAMVCAAGCAKSNFQFTRQDQGNVRQVTDSAVANAPEEKPPKILPETHFAAGMLFERQGQFDRAIFQYRKAVALNAHYIVAFHRLGLLQSRTGQHLEATQTLKRAVALRPDNAVLHNDLGFELMHTQQWEDAERELRLAIELQPDLATAHINLGMVLSKAERFAESLASFQAVLPEADANYNMGLMYQGQKRHAEAQEAFRHVLTIDPEFSAAKIQLARLASGNVPLTTAEGVEVVAETPKLERVDNQVPVVTGDTLPPITGPEFIEEQHAVECKHAWETKLADLAAMLTVIDANKSWVRPVDRPTAAPPSSVGSSDPCEEELIAPSVVVSTEHAVAAFEEFEYEEPVALVFFQEAQTTVETAEIAEPPVPCAAESEEIAAHERVAALPPATPIRSMKARNSWTMIEELEAKVVKLRDETKATKKKLVSATWP